MTERTPVNQNSSSSAGSRVTNGVARSSSSGAGPARRPAGNGRRRGLSKAALAKAKLAAVALSAVAFVGSLFGVVRATPNFVTPASATQPGSPSVVAPAPAQVSQLAPLPQAPVFSMPQSPQAPAFRPLVRSRGS